MKDLYDLIPVLKEAQDTIEKQNVMISEYEQENRQLSEAYYILKNSIVAVTEGVDGTSV